MEGDNEQSTCPAHSTCSCGSGKPGGECCQEGAACTCNADVAGGGAAEEESSSDAGAAAGEEHQAM